MLTFVAISLLTHAAEGVKCTQHRGSRVNVTREQWLTIREVIRSHDPKRLAPFISENGLMETSLHNESLTRKPKFRAYSKWVSKKQFLDGLTKITFHEKTANTGNDEDMVFIYAWFGLASFGQEGVEGRPAVSTHKRSDVWYSHNDGSEGRFRFVCENGWLKIAEIKAALPPDP